MIRGAQPAADAGAVLHLQITGWGQQLIWSLLHSIPTPESHREHGAKVMVKVKIEGHSGEFDLAVVLKSDSLFSLCNESSKGFLSPFHPLPLPVLHKLVSVSAAEPKSSSPSPPLSHRPARLAGWLAGSPTLLSFSSTAPLSVSFKPPLLASSPSLPRAPQLAPYLTAMQPAASNKPGDCFEWSPPLFSTSLPDSKHPLWAYLSTLPPSPLLL
ncbi:hypothetical protein D5F01_LYC04777 [Larimichthys crocea]|uniref:Uncharacterized protein n=1 Tax=Larimichthys crocea TaxID=215358 RepID=A0A6G0IXG6_LARCR|nr:hypothetical protein D5F01_LYC04777 [Larimichthys crocea]